MQEYLSLNQNKRQKITKKVKQILSAEKDVVFGFIFGSFLDAPSFRDIDIGVYVDSIRENEVFDYELKLSKKIADECDFSFDIFDVKVLNFAPSHFLNNIFSRGKLISCKNRQLLSAMIERTSLDAVSNEHIVHQSLKELVPA